MNPNLSERQFYHGTRAVLRPGDHIEAGHQTNYPELDDDPDRAGAVWMTPVKKQAWKFAGQALGTGRRRVYQVAPTGSVHWDEETNPEDFYSDKDMERRGSRRTYSPLRVIDEL